MSLLPVFVWLALTLLIGYGTYSLLRDTDSDRDKLLILAGALLLLAYMTTQVATHYYPAGAEYMIRTDH
jgi:hypothetical protein